MNNDGIEDLVVGERANQVGKAGVHYYCRSTDGSLSYVGKLQFRDTDGTEHDIAVSNNSSPCVADLNGDNLPDLVVTDEGASIYTDPGYARYYKNIGTSSSPLFAPSIKLKHGTEEIRQARGQVELYDLDSDGKKDLIIGNVNGKIVFYKNTSAGDDISFGTGESINCRNQILELPKELGKVSCQLSISDFDNDGTPDIIAGNAGKYVYIYRGIPSSTEIDEGYLSNGVTGTIEVSNMALKISSYENVQGVTICSLNGKVLLRTTAIQGSIPLPKYLSHKMCLITVSGNGWSKTEKVLLK